MGSRSSEDHPSPGPREQLQAPPPGSRRRPFCAATPPTTGPRLDTPRPPLSSALVPVACRPLQRQERRTPASPAAQDRRRRSTLRHGPPRGSQRPQVDYACRVVPSRPKPRSNQPRQGRVPPTPVERRRGAELRRAAPLPRAPHLPWIARSKSYGPQRSRPKSTRPDNGQRWQFFKRDLTFSHN